MIKIELDLHPFELALLRELGHLHKRILIVNEANPTWVLPRHKMSGRTALWWRDLDNKIDSAIRIKQRECSPYVGIVAEPKAIKEFTDTVLTR